MFIAFDMLVAEQEQGEALFSTRLLLEKLAAIDAKNDYMIITGCPQIYQFLINRGNIHFYRVKMRWWQGILTQHQLLVPDILKRLRPDILHVPNSAAPIGWQGTLVLAIHSFTLLDEHYFSSCLHARLYWNYLLEESMRRAQGIIATTEHTRQQLMTRWPIEQERMYTVAYKANAEVMLQIYQTALARGDGQAYAVR